MREATLEKHDARFDPIAAWQRVFLFTTAVLSSTIILKIASVQYLEYVYLVLIAVLSLLFAERGFHGHLYKPLARLAGLYGFVCLAALALAIAALRFDFYPPDDGGFLKTPIIITLSRMIELIGSVAAMIYIANIFRNNLTKARFTMRVYFWTGFVSALFSVLSWPLAFAGVAELGAYNPGARMRGFFNEGGPYGLYVMSVFLVGLALVRLGWEPKVRTYLAMTSLAVAFIFSYSKAAIFAMAFLLLINALVSGSFRQRITILGVGCCGLLLIFQVVNVGAATQAYQTGSKAYERLSRLHPHDGNIVLGRVAGLFIVPRMIAAHPLSGIGWGNYSLLRNAPEYRGRSAYVSEADEPGLGLLGIVADLGLPLSGLLLVCLLMPYFFLRQLKAPIFLRNLALLQPVVHLFGAQLNVTYPWVVSAFALGLGYGLSGQQPLAGHLNDQRLEIIL